MIVGKGMFIWNVWNTEGGDVAKALEVAKSAGLNHILVKIADGVLAFNVRDGRDYAAEFAHAFKQEGLAVFGWQYVYGQNPEKEAEVAIRRIHECGVDGFVVDAEAEYKNKPKQAEQYMTKLRVALGSGFPIGLSSYRFPNLHREFPFNAFLKYCDLNLPQVYWMQAHNPRQQLESCLSQYRQTWLFQRPIVPTGAAFQEHGWRPTAKEIYEFLDAAAKYCAGANFWVWEHARRYGDLWLAIQNYEWGNSEMNGLSLKVVAPRVNIRDRASVSGNVIGVLLKDDLVSVSDIYVESGKRVWIRHDKGWSAVVYDDVVLMKSVQQERR